MLFINLIKKHGLEMTFYVILANIFSLIINAFLIFQLMVICDRRFVGAARFCAKWGIKLVQATLIPLARSYFPLNCEQADRQILGLSVKSGLIIVLNPIININCH